jgi:hypothetical protein
MDKKLGIIAQNPPFTRILRAGRQSAPQGLKDEPVTAFLNREPFPGSADN